MKLPTKSIVVVALVALVALVIAACAISYEVGRSSSSGKVSESFIISQSGKWDSNDVPVRACPSSYGVNTKTRHKPKTIRIATATKRSSQLTFYTDAKYLLTPVLGPTGWKCSASLGADGSALISIYPPGVRNPVEIQNGTEQTMGIEVTFFPVCRGCVADLVCPVFLNAETQLGYSGQVCPTFMPSSESVRFLDGTNAESNFGVALLIDPPGSPGTVTLSGGDYPAVGALFYSNSSPFASGGSIGCVLPRIYAKLCNIIVNQFVATYAKGA